MSWASRRRLYIGGGVCAVLVAALAIILIATFYKAPTCVDSKQDGDETGVDCGGSCTTLCTVDENAPTVDFVRQLSPAPGRTDVIAYVTNSNPDAAAEAAPFTISLYGPDGILVASKQGTTDLPPGTVVPVYVPDFFSGNQQVARAFLSFDNGLRWLRYADTRVIPKAGSYSVANEAVAPRITATVSNPSPSPLYNVKVIATAFGADGNAIGASQTVLPAIPANGESMATFTWNAPFAAPIARVDILPVIPLSP
ncbi:MAG TPA: hypothetical protein VF439_01055 [Candidatus Paceibacterota bacterium]